MNIAIPEYFSLYNEDMRENLEEKDLPVFPDQLHVFQTSG